MKKNIYFLLLITFILLLFLFFIEESFTIIHEVELDELKYGTSDSSKIPNIIWSFWEGEENKFVNECINSWKHYNPDYQINILNKETYLKYVDMDIDNIKHSTDFVARYADYVRLVVLSKYGGIWIDASIICHRPFTWIHAVQNKTDAEYVGYYMPNFTMDEYLYKSPIIENWFFACVPESPFVNDWKNEFFRTSQFENISDYVQDLKNDNVDFQKIDNPDYLTMHCSAQKILQKNKDKYNIVLFSAKSPFKFLYDKDWNSSDAINNLINENSHKIYHEYPIVKIRGCERGVIDDNNIKNMFNNPLSSK